MHGAHAALLGIWLLVECGGSMVTFTGLYRRD